MLGNCQHATSSVVPLKANDSGIEECALKQCSHISAPAAYKDQMVSTERNLKAFRLIVIVCFFELECCASHFIHNTLPAVA